MCILCVMNDSELNSQLCSTLYSEATRHQDQILYIRHRVRCVWGGGGADYCDYVLHYGNMLFDSMCAIMFTSPGSGHSPDSPAQGVLVP